MIVDLNGSTLRDARAAAHHFLERTGSLREASSRRRLIKPAHANIERARMRLKVGGTRKMRAALLDELEAMRKHVLRSFGLREADGGDGVTAGIDAATASGAITYAERQDLINKLRDALNSIDPKRIARTIHEIQTELYQLGMQSASTEIGFSWDTPPQGALDAMYQSTLEFSQDIVDREKVAIKDALMIGVNEGESSAQIAQRIRDTLDDGVHILDAGGDVTRVLPADSWAEMVARTEVTKAMTAGIFDTYRTAGVKRIMWLSAEDERTCPICDDLDGESVALGALFGGEFDGPPAHPSCRCTVVSDDSSNGGTDE